MKVWTFTGNGCETSFVDMEMGDRVTVFRCGGGMTKSEWNLIADKVFRSLTS